MKPEDIHINWHMQDPPVAPSQWRTWKDADFANQPASTATDDVLASPAFTAPLAQAFMERLPRSTGWRADPDLSNAAKELLVYAASLYKRGVAFSVGQTPPEIRSKSGSYPVRILTEDRELLSTFAQENFLVVDKQVFLQHARYFSARPDALVLELDEHSKTGSSVEMINAVWRKTGQKMQWCIVGGGVVTDTAAFAASLCGCKSTFVPTTILAMADACVGGKTGVNVPPFGKNLIGHFYFPERVLVWSEFLTTLPPRQITAGVFECIKHYLIQNDINAAETFVSLINSGNIKNVSAELPGIIKVKARIVAEDPAETGKRAVLNLGHTLGHAIEGVSQKLTTGEQTILHGEAVGFGLLFAIFLSTKVSGLGQVRADRATRVLKKAGPMLTRENLSAFFAGHDPGSEDMITALSSFIGQDKKGGTTSSPAAKWVLLGESGGIFGPKPQQWLTTVSMTDFRVHWCEFLQIMNNYG